MGIVLILLSAPIAVAEDMGERQDSQPATQSQQAEPGTSQARPTPAPEPPRAASAEKEQPTPDYNTNPCEHPRDRADSDSCSQRRSADAAERSAYLNWHQVIAAYAGAFIGLVAAIATVSAAWAAVLAARAAVDSVGAERAWMSFEEPIYYHITNGFFGDEIYDRAIGVAFKWKNTGRSPAINVNILMATRMIGLTDTIMPFIPKSPPLDTAQGVFGPNCTNSSQTHYLYGRALDEFFRGEIRLIVYSRVTYETVSAPGVERCSEACFEVHHNGSIEAENGKHMERFFLRGVGTQNTAT